MMVVHRLRVLGILLCLVMLGPPGLAAAQTLPPTTLSAQEQAFLDDLQDQIDWGILIANDASSALDIASPGSARFGRLWKAVMLDFEDLNAEALALKPSPRQAHLAVIWIESTSTISLGAQRFWVGFQANDAETIGEASDIIETAAALNTTLSADRTAFQDDPNAVLRRAVRIESPVTSCDEFTSYQVAQVYYALHPKERTVLDANRDGRACDREFDRVTPLTHDVPSFASESASTPSSARPTTAPEGPTPKSTPASAKPTKTTGATSTSTDAPRPTNPPTATVKPSATQTAIPSPTPAANGDHLTFEGTGSKVKTFTISEKGLYLMTIQTTATYAGVTIYTMDGEPVSSTLSGKAGETNEAAILLESGDYYAQIAGTDGDWTVTIEPLT